MVSKFHIFSKGPLGPSISAGPSSPEQRACTCYFGCSNSCVHTLTLFLQIHLSCPALQRWFLYFLRQKTHANTWSQNTPCAGWMYLIKDLMGQKLMEMIDPWRSMQKQLRSLIWLFKLQAHLKHEVCSLKSLWKTSHVTSASWQLPSPC